MSEPKYDEDLVNLGYLKRVISDTEEGINIDFKNVSRHYGSQPIPPYYEGDTWVDGNIVYTCINTRLVGSYTASDWVTESGALQRADNKSKVFLTQPSNYKPGDMWILQSDNDHRAGKKGEILITTAGRAVYDSDDWVNMLGYGTIRSINEVADNLNNAITRIGVVEEAIEDGIIITFYQASEPEGVHIGDLWYVTGEVTGYTEGKIYRYNGSTWDLLDDPAIQEAFDEANNARLVADGKIQSFYSASEPTSGDIGVGDLWIDTDDNNKLYRYNGTNWVACYDTRIDDLVETVEETTERVTTIETDLGEIDLTVKETTTRVTTVEGNITNLQAQIDGAIQFWNGSAIPTLSNYPANEWTTEALKNNHRADIYTVIQDVSGELKQGKSYRFDKVGSTWQWVELTDNELSAVQALANSKAKVFITTPTVPYSVGDLWLKDGKLYRCKTAKGNTGGYDISDWGEAVEYTDDTAANLAKGLANAAQDTADGAVTAINNIKDTKGQAEGKIIYINDSANEPIISAKFNGETRQETRSGKNILGLTNGTYTNRGITAVVSNGVITLSGTSNDSSTASIIDIPLINPILSSAGTLTKSLNPTRTYTGVQTSIRNTSGNSVGLWSNDATNTTATLSEDGYKLRIQINYNITVNCTLKPQVETGSSATSWEQGGLSPSPDYPSEIKNLEGRNIFNKNANIIGTVASKTVLDTGVRAISTVTGTFRYFSIRLGGSELLGKTITVRATMTPSSNNNGRIALYFGDDTLPARAGAGIMFDSSGNATRTLVSSFPDNCNGLYILFYSNRNGTGNVGDYVDYTNVQVEFGSDVTSYTEYNSLRVDAINKNLINVENYTGTLNAYFVDRITDFHLQEGKTYTLSLDVTSSVGSFNVSVGCGKNAYQKDIATIQNQQNGRKTITFTPTAAQLAYGTTFCFRAPRYTSSQSGVTYSVSNIQLETGSIATDFIEHQEQTVYFPLAEGQKLYEGSYLADDGIHNVRKQVVLDGTESWNIWSASLTNVERFFVNLSVPTKNIKTALCSHFKFLNANQDEEHFRWSTADGVYKQFVVFIDKSKATTVAQFKTWLQSNPITLEYELANPETDGFVPYNTDQQAAWEQIKQLHTYKNITNIYSDAYAEIEYVRDNGLDIYETKHEAERKYVETTEKFAQQNITNERINNVVSETVTRLNNDYLTAEQVEAEIGTTKDDIEILKQKQASTELTSEAFRIEIDNIVNNGVSKVKTAMGYTFDDEGMKINKDNAETGTIIDEAAVKVKDKTGASQRNLLYAGYVKQGDTDYPAYIGQTIVAGANMIIENYLVVPNSRFEAYENPVLGGHGTGVFGV